MRDLATTVLGWLHEGYDVTLARFISMDGFGGRRAGEMTIVREDGEHIGSVLGGAADAAIAGSDLFNGAVRVTVGVSDADAVGCGLACGGRAELLVQSAGQIPALAWKAMATGESVVIATLLGGEWAGRTVAIKPDGTLEGTLGHPAVTLQAIQAAEELLGRAKDLSRLITTEAGDVLVALLRPPSQVLVIGEATLADALARQGALLGWTTTVVSDREAPALLAARATDLGPADAIVVLSHDLDASCAALNAALTGRCGYVGALGSRHTQAARGERLRTAHGLDDDTVARVHGPVGLDLGSRTPEETALAIAAEIVAVLAGRSAASLRGSSGPING